MVFLPLKVGLPTSLVIKLIFSGSQIALLTDKPKTFSVRIMLAAARGFHCTFQTNNAPQIACHR